MLSGGLRLADTTKQPKLTGLAEQARAEVKRGIVMPEVLSFESARQFLVKSDQVLLKKGARGTLREGKAFCQASI
jgi:hypothetical protein